MNSDPIPAPLNRGDLCCAACIGILALVAYVATLAPGLLPNDSGEFQTLAYTLGYTHPTGYPVYLLLGKLTTLLPVGDVAYRVNLLSGVMGAISVTGLVLLVTMLTGKRRIAMVAGIALAISPTFWSQAIIAEVYTPGAAFMIAVLVCLHGWQQTLRWGWLFAAAALGGLSIAVHSTVSFLAPAALVFLALESRQRIRNWSVAISGAMVGVLLTLAAFLVVDSHRPPSDYFRAVVEPSRSEWQLEAGELDRFSSRTRFSLSGRQYQSKMFQRSADELQRQLSDYLSNLSREFPPVWLLASAVGFLGLIRSNWKFGLLVSMTLLTHLAYVFSYDMGDIHVCYIPTYVCVAIYGGVGFGVFAGLLAKWPYRWAASSHWPVRLVATLAVVVLVWPLFQDGAWNGESRRSVWVPPGEPPFRVEISEANQILHGVIGELEDDAILFTDWSLLYPYYYIAHVEQGRTGMRFVQTRPGIGQQQLATSAIAYIDQHVDSSHVYMSQPLPELGEKFVFEPVHRGAMRLYRVHRRNGTQP